MPKVLASSCTAHHVCSCIAERLSFAEEVIRRVNQEFGGMHLLLNGVGHTTIRKYLRLEEAIKAIHRD